VEELSRTLGLASATIRRHLDILQRDGMVLYERVRKKAGRPEYAYYLSEAGQEALPKEYHRLLGLLLRELRELPPSELSQADGGPALMGRLFSRIARRVVSEYEHANDQATPLDLSQRVQAAVEVLEREQFLPQVEEEDGKVRIRLLNCPFRTVAREEEAVCSFDAYLITRLTGVPVVREGSITAGSPYCIYLLTPLPEP